MSSPVSLFVVALFFAATSFVLFFLAFRSGMLPETSDSRSLKKALSHVKKDRKARKKGKKRRQQSDEMIWYDAKPQKNPYILEKWLSFGGGFYGTAALVTYMVIEYAEIMAFLENFTSLADFIARIGLGMVIAFLVESILNFVTALVWPVYWLAKTGGAIILPLIAAYIGYLGGRHYSRVALQAARNRQNAVVAEGDSAE